MKLYNGIIRAHTPSMLNMRLSVVVLSICLLFARSSAWQQKGWFCGTHSTPMAVESVLSSQRNIFGRALHDIKNTTQRANVLKATFFPQGVKIKVQVVNCAGSEYAGFGVSMRKLNNAFVSTGIQFVFDGDEESCTWEEMQEIRMACPWPDNGQFPSPNCPKALLKIADRMSYQNGILVSVLGIEFGGMANNVGLFDDVYPLIAVGVNQLPEVTPMWNVGTPSQHENLGVVLTHEVGHILGLFHTFENGCSHPGDYIPDTPFEATPLDNLPEYLPTLECCAQRPTDQCSPPSTCENVAGNNYDNYMDYSPDSCQKKFTPDQIAAMQATLLDKRPEWLGLSKKPSIDDIAIQQELGGGTHNIEGSFRDGTDISIEWNPVSRCPEDSNWTKQFYLQPRKLVYSVSVPDSTASIDIKKCNFSVDDAVVSLTYLECRSYDSCRCQVVQCVSSESVTITVGNTMGQAATRLFYLILTNDEYAGNQMKVNVEISVELGQTQSPPLQLPSPISLPSPSPEPKPNEDTSITEGVYAFGPTQGPCKGRYISANPGTRCNTHVVMRNFKQASSNSSILKWRVTESKRLESLAAKRIYCKSKYLASPRSGAKLGGSRWKWDIVVVGRNGNRNVVNLVSRNRPGGPSYLKVDSKCSLTFTLGNDAQSQFEAIDYSFMY